MQAKTIYKKRGDISVRSLGKDLMLYDEKNDKVHILNETGALLWNLLDGENKLLDIKKRFMEQFPDTDEKEILADINNIIERLAHEGLCC